MSKRPYPGDSKINCDQLAEYLGGYGLGQRKLYFNTIPVNTVKDWVRAGNLEMSAASFSTLQIWLDPSNYAEAHCKNLASDALSGFRLMFGRSLPSPRKQARYVEPEYSEFARRNESWTSRPEAEPFQTGSFMTVYMAKYIDGPRLGEECVKKVFKGKKVFDAAKFDNEIRVTEKALEIITKFNKDPKILNPFPTARKLRMLVSIPQVFTEICNLPDREKERCLVEPYIPNFEKMNSNTGWTAKKLKDFNWFECTQALSHYSYHISDGELLICDIQGGQQDDGVTFILSDPAIMSVKQEFGATDLGIDGISSFFATHKCNIRCDSTWKKPVDATAVFSSRRKTTMVVKRETMPEYRQEEVDEVVDDADKRRVVRNAILRVLKRDQALSIVELFKAVVDNVEIFNAKAPMIKEQIDFLADDCKIARDAENRYYSRA